MSHAATTELVDQLRDGEKNYAEVLSEGTMHVELARYPNPSPKHPHKEDELYYIIEGSGMVSVGEETFAVSDGDVVFVEQGTEHDFFDVDEEITALIVFAGGEESILE